MDASEEENWLTAENTRFRPLMRRYGWRELALRPLTLLSTAAITAPFVYATSDGEVGPASLQTIGTAYIAAGAALFGIVLAGLAVLGAFAGGQSFQTFLRDAQRRRETYTEFYWVAVVSVASITATVLLLLITYVTDNKAILAVATGVASGLFFSALFNSLWLVGSIVRLGLYGPAAEELRDYLEPPGS